MTEDDDQMAYSRPGGQTAEQYRQHALKCRGAADKATDPETRDEWVRLGNQWTYLALRVERQTRT